MMKTYKVNTGQKTYTVNDVNGLEVSHLGVLVLRDVDGHAIALFAPGQWTSVILVE